MRGRQANRAAENEAVMASWADQLQRTGRVGFTLSPLRLSVLLMLSLPFVTMGLLMITVARSFAELALAIACIVFFGTGVVMFTMRLLARGPSVMVDARGVRTPSERLVVPWPQLRGASSYSTHHTHLVVLVVTPQFAASWRAQRHWAARALSRANRVFAGGLETITLPRPAQRRSGAVS